MSDGESAAKYFPDDCPECQQEYEWINVLELSRRGEEPDYMFVHDSEIEGPFTRIAESCRVCEHVAHPEWDSSGCLDGDDHEWSESSYSHRPKQQRTDQSTVTSDGNLAAGEST